MRFMDKDLSAKMEYIFNKVEVLTPYGLRNKKSMKPYKPGQEDKLIQEHMEVAIVKSLIEDDKKRSQKIIEILAHVKDITTSVERSKQEVLTEIDIYEIKNFLLQLVEIEKLIKDIVKRLPNDMHVYGIPSLMKTLDPNDEKMGTFYIYDAYSKQLESLRKNKKITEQKINTERQNIKKILDEAYNISVTPKGEVHIIKDNETQIERVKEIPFLYFNSESYLHYIYAIKETQEILAYKAQVETIKHQIEDEEYRIKQMISKEIYSYYQDLKKNMLHLGNLDFRMAKANMAIHTNAMQPKINKKHQIKILNGRHLEVEEMLNKKNEVYMPISISLEKGVTCITGANMGGKTITLELIAITAAMAQYGLFVPCKNLEMGLSNYIFTNMGDHQSISRGLSSFGGEIEDIQRALENREDRGLLLIDEFASGTNPFEGWAISKGLIKYMNHRNDITVMTTHYDRIATDKAVVNMQVMGLSRVDYEKLKREIEFAQKKDKLRIIRKYMDYRLKKISTTNDVPKDALKIAALMGFDKEIIEEAEKQYNPNLLDD